MKGINLPLWEARRLLGLTLGLHGRPTRARSSSLAFPRLSMTFARGETTALNYDSIQLAVKGEDLTTKALVGGSQDIQRIQVNLHTPLGLGTATETVDKSANNRVFAKILGAASSINSRSGLDLGHALTDRILGSSPNVRSCTVRIQCLPSPDHSRYGLRGRTFTVKKRIGTKVEHENIPGTVTRQVDSSRTEWAMRLDLGLLSDRFTRDNAPMHLKIWLNREYEGTTISYSAPNSREPELNTLSPQMPGSATVPDRGADDIDLHVQLARLARTTPFSTAEALASHLADKAYAIADAKYPNNGITFVAIRIGGKDAGDGVGQAAVVIRRGRSDLSCRPGEQLARLRAQGKHRAVIALGANIGDRIGNIEEACRVIENHGMRIIQTSLLYETEAMYVVNQDPFINGACEVETTLGPEELLNELQDTEISLGREKAIEKGPRNIDLDILLYDTLTFKNERLSIPHKLMLEREFVLRPLCDLIPQESLPEPLSSQPFRAHLDALQPLASKPLATATPFCQHLPPLKALDPSRHTHVMAILNLTPDSFSDGGVHSPTDLVSLSQTIKSHITAGASILDIGGQSTRPGAADVGEAEELQRVIPAIKLIRSMPEGANIAISIDTYRAPVAAEAVAAGADIINDVSGGTLDPDMLSTAARTGKTVVLMHMRGTPETMTTMTDYPDGIVETVARELLARVRAAEAAGVRRWRIVLDPGIGFAKTQAQNIELLRRLDDLRGYEGLRGMPWLVGASRKGFVGKVTGVKEPRERVWGTAATVTAAVQGGADIVRVHDVEEMAKVVRMADAIWRG